MLESAQAETESTLDDLRQLVRVLRIRGEMADLVAAPTLIDLPELIASVHAFYPEVGITVEGPLSGLDAAHSLACYRNIQESLANAPRHAQKTRMIVRIQCIHNSVRIETMSGPSIGRFLLKTGKPEAYAEPVRAAARGKEMVSPRVAKRVLAV